MQLLERSMMEREETIKVLKDKTNRVEDEIFEDFCEQIGVDNIRYCCIPLKLKVQGGAIVSA